MKVRHLLTGLGVVLCGGVFSSSVFAVTYTSEATVQFNFNSEINVVIDTADIEILDLAPGTSADSNVVGISISTNNVVGYTASATVGSAQNATTNMTHTNGTNTFASIATDADLSSLTTDNTWGYSTSTDNGTSWSNFSGLPVYTDTAKQIATTSSPANDAIKFKINAKASTSQPAGDYTNVINFTVVANVPPRDFPDVIPPDGPKDPETNRPTIQSINESICEQVEAYDTQFLVTDIRDHKNYWISKLRDGYCWMTQNLDLDLDSTKTYTSANTDLGWNGIGYTSTSWQPSLSTIPSTDIDSTTGNIIGWQASSSDPYSVDVGNLYWISSTNTYSETPDPASGEHTHLGNYYNFIAPTANNTSIESPYSNQPNSICPTNWGLPPIGQYRSLNDLSQYYGNTTATGQYYIASPLYFVIGEQIYASYDSATSQIVGKHSTGTGSGFYWYNSRAALQLYPDAVSFTSPDLYIGNNIRCRIREKDKFTINFNANNGEGSMSAQKVSYGGSVALAANTFTRSGYYFNGWNTAANGTGVGYGNGGSYSAPSTNATTSVTLYAQWVEDTGQGGGSYGKTLQDAYEMAYVTNPGGFQEGGNNKHGLYVPHKTNGEYDGTYFEATKASDYEGIPANDLRFAIQDIALTINNVKVCDYATVIGSSAYVLDLRDFTSYHIIKAADGRCWLADNLAFNPLASGVTMNENNTNAPAAAITNFLGGNAGTQSGWSSSAVGYWGNTTYTEPRINVNYRNTVTNDSLDTAGGYKVGVYYNFCAASVGTFCYSSDTSLDRPDTAIDAEYDICPSGWRMPTGGYTGGEYLSAKNAYGDYTSLRLALRLPLSGLYSYAVFLHGQYGRFWSSTRFISSSPGENEMAILGLDQSSVSANGGLYRDHGFNIRCIAK